MPIPTTSTILQLPSVTISLNAMREIHRAAIAVPTIIAPGKYFVIGLSKPTMEPASDTCENIYPD